MKKYLFALGLFLSSTVGVFAQKTAKEDSLQYMKVITKRSEKIVNVLGITDSAKYKAVCNIIINQYRSLSDIHDTHDALVKEIKSEDKNDKAKLKTRVAQADSDMSKKLSGLHADYLAKLGAELTPAQIDKVKDAMTYKILPLTYAAYLDELPSLNDTQKQTIKQMLIEAREHAIDAGSAKGKHAWFGKYKGRINNYLSAQGYDMKKAGEEWQQRLKEKKENAGQKG